MIEMTHEAGKAKDLGSYLQSILSAGIELTKSETASILEYDPAARVLHFTAVPWFHQDALRPMNVPLEGSAAGWVIQNGQPLSIPDVAKDERHFQGADQASRYETRSLLAVPLFHAGQAIGVMEALNKSGDDHYTEEDAAILETLAALACLAIRNDMLEQQMQSSYHELVELDRLKNDFIAITSHELRTPLGLILGHATYLRESVGQEQKEQVDAILKNTGKLKEIVETLARVDNYEAGVSRLRQQKVSMKQLIEDVAASFQEMSKHKEVSLSVSINPNADLGAGRRERKDGNLLVEADGSKIAIALSNLVKNAISFTDAGGHVRIEAQGIPGFVQVAVSDDGVGIPPKDLVRIFERFFQVESHLTRRHGGMGLGLSVAKVMIEMHGGRIWAESVEGKGSRFTFLLPLERGQVDTPERED